MSNKPIDVVRRIVSKPSEQQKSSAERFLTVERSVNFMQIMTMFRAQPLMDAYTPRSASGQNTSTLYQVSQLPLRHEAAHNVPHSFFAELGVISISSALLGLVSVPIAHPAQVVATYYKLHEDSSSMVSFLSHARSKYGPGIGALKAFYPKVVAMTKISAPSKIGFIVPFRVSEYIATELGNHYESATLRNIFSVTGFGVGLELSAQIQGRITFSRQMSLYHSMSQSRLGGTNTSANVFWQPQFRPFLKDWIMYNRLANGITIGFYEMTKKYLESSHPELSDYHKEIAVLGILAAQFALVVPDRIYTLKMTAKNHNLQWRELFHGAATRRAVVARIVWKLVENAVAIAGSDMLQDNIRESISHSLT